MPGVGTVMVVGEAGAVAGHTVGRWRIVDHDHVAPAGPAGCALLLGVALLIRSRRVLDRGLAGAGQPQAATSSGYGLIASSMIE